MDERVRFVVEVDCKEQSMTTLCAWYGISRETGYMWLALYRRGGFGALSDVSRARSTQAEATPGWMSTMIRTLREDYPHRGPKKLRAVLART